MFQDAAHDEVPTRNPGAKAAIKRTCPSHRWQLPWPRVLRMSSCLSKHLSPSPHSDGHPRLPEDLDSCRAEEYCEANYLYCQSAATVPMPLASAFRPRNLVSQLRRGLLKALPRIDPSSTEQVRSPKDLQPRCTSSSIFSCLATPRESKILSSHDEVRRCELAAGLCRSRTSCQTRFSFASCIMRSQRRATSTERNDL